MAERIAAALGLSAVGIWFVVAIGVVIGLFIGWVRNIIWIFTGLSFDDGTSVQEVLALIGIVVGPLGGVMGWLH